MIASSVVSKLRDLVARLSPRRRRWERFLEGLRLDPEHLPRPLGPPPDDDFIICGAPRTGTTLVAAVLFQPPRVITVMEPWDGMRLPPAELLASLRTEIEETGRLRRGKLDVDALLEDGEVRWCAEGESTPPLTIDGDTSLGVKWPAYWRYLDLLPRTKFLVCVREPFEVVNSFKAKGGRLGEGLEYDVAFNRTLNEELLAATEDRALRRVLLYETIHRKVLPHLSRPEVFTVRYERWFDEPEKLLAELADFLGVHLEAGPARIRPSPRDDRLTSSERALVRQHCRSAEALGYRLSEPGSSS